VTMDAHEREHLLEASLRYFGAMAASISHELTNALAIINENAGLLDDLTLRAQSGAPVDPDRLRTLAGRVTGQIRRADGIVRNLNAFAHSVDEPVASVDLAEVLGLVVATSERLVTRRGVGVETAPGPGVPVRTVPFLLEHLAWRCVDHAAGAAGEGRTVTVEALRRDGGAIARISWPAGSGAPAGPFPTERETTLAGFLCADIECSPDRGEIVINLPDDVGHAGRCREEA
jgi:signal transduction histidine kinase